MKSVIWVFDGVVVLMSVAFGFFVGLFGLGMAQLIGAGAWAYVIVLTVFAICLFFIVSVSGWGFDYFSGIKPAPAGTKKTNSFEKRRKRNGRIGFFIGVVVALVASLFMPIDQIMGYF